jgi:hypothetical protein
VPLIISPSIAAGTWLVGAFAQSTVLVVRQQMTIEFSFEDQDSFVEPMHDPSGRAYDFGHSGRCGAAQGRGHAGRAV